MHISRFALAVASAGLLSAGLLPLAAQAETLKFQATLSAATEVPPKASKGTGELQASLDTATKTLSYTTTYSGLTGPATAAHFHGPADPGVNAGLMVPVKNVANPISGTATLNESEIADLTAGKWYFNIHTKAHPGGEIRGQVMAAQ